jgi:hypothetical protein
MNDSCPICSSVLPEGVRICPRCVDVRDANLPVVEAPASDATKSSNPEIYQPKIGGWLSFVRAGLVIWAVVSGAFAISVNYELDNGLFHQLFARDSEIAHLCSLEIGTNIARVAALACLMVLFSKRKRLFVRCMIAYLVIQFSLSVLDHMAASAVARSIFEGEVTVELISLTALFPAEVFGLFVAFVIALVFIPYFLRSQRVRAAFVR